MTIIFEELLESRSQSVKDQKLTLRFKLIGIHDHAYARNYALAYTSVFYDGLFREDLQLEYKGNLFWLVTAMYGPIPKYQGSVRISCDTTGGTVRIFASKSMVSKYPAGTAPDTRAIGKKGTEVEGCDVVIPASKRTYTFRHPKGVVTERYMDYMETITGLVNSAAWHGRPAGEVLFLGFQGNSTIAAECEAEVSYNFAMSKNATGLSFGSITGVAKQGHDYLDILWEDAAPGGQPVKQAKFVYIHRVYDRQDFNSILGF